MSDGQQLVIDVQTSTLQGKSFTFEAADLEAGVVLGRADDCHVSFDLDRDDKVSSRHAELKLVGGALTVRDLGSSNGTFLGERKLAPDALTKVDSGATLTLGREGAELTLTMRQIGRHVPTRIEGARSVEEMLAPAPPVPNPLTVDVIVDEIAASSGATTRDVDMMKQVARKLDERSKAKHSSLARRLVVLVVLVIAVVVGLKAFEKEPEPQPVAKQPEHKPQESARDQLKGHYARFKQSVVLIMSTINLVDQSGRTRMTAPLGVGTGWVVRLDANSAYIVTNKHVAEGYKFEPRGQMLTMMQTHRLQGDPRTVTWTIWPGGAVFRSHPEGGFETFDFTTAWTSYGPMRERSLGGVTFIGSAPDEWNDAMFSLPTGPIRTHKVNTRHDLSLLKIERKKKDSLLRALPVAARGDGAKLPELEAVAALGYPLGMSWVGTKADPSPTMGEVRGHMPESGTLKVGAFATGGNSGGPVLDRHGRVVGVFARGWAGMSGFGGAIHVKYVHDLLEDQLGAKWAGPGK